MLALHITKVIIKSPVRPSLTCRKRKQRKVDKKRLKHTRRHGIEQLSTRRSDEHEPRIGHAVLSWGPCYLD